MSEFKPWVWAVIDYSTAILYEADSDPEEGCIMDVHPCGSCMDRAKEKGDDWKWGLCTTPSEKDAQLIASAPELLLALQALLKVVNFKDSDFEHLRSAQINAEEAIKKATGKI